MALARTSSPRTRMNSVCSLSAAAQTGSGFLWLQVIRARVRSYAPAAAARTRSVRTGWMFWSDHVMLLTLYAASRFNARQLFEAAHLYKQALTTRPLLSFPAAPERGRTARTHHAAEFKFSE